METVKGRPRSDTAHQAILKAALEEVLEKGFRGMSMDSAAARAGVGKMTIYRRWPNKGAMLMDAFLELVGPETAFPSDKNILERIRLQLRAQADFFAGQYGGVIRSLLGEAQFDRDVEDAFHQRWLLPRRVMTQDILKEAIGQGKLREGLDLEILTDQLYGPFYYRLQLKSGPMNQEFADAMFDAFLRSAGVSNT